MTSELPPEYQRLASLIDQQPPAVREVVHLILAVALEKSGKARMANTFQGEGRVHYAYETVAGDVFTLVRPEIDAEKEEEVRTIAAEILKREGRSGTP